MLRLLSRAVVLVRARAVTSAGGKYSQASGFHDGCAGLSAAAPFVGYHRSHLQPEQVGCVLVGTGRRRPDLTNQS